MKKQEKGRAEALPKAAEPMRLDKYLKVSRIIKRRSVANEACDTGHVMLNGKEAKAGAEVHAGDIVSVRYGERLKTHGLNLLSAPGNDAVATSALAGAGCHMVLFSTGRGTPYGGFVPTVKIATNSELAAKKKHWIDFDAGQLIHGKAMPQLLSEFVDTIVEFANGKQTCNERNDFRELAIFKSGVTL